MRFLPWVIAALLAIVLVVTFREFLGSMLFVPDGRNLVRNGSFEAGNPTATDDEPFVTGPNCKVLCDGSSAIDDWQVSGNGPPHPPRTCTNGKAFDEAPALAVARMSRS
jgi:hypothetical protein